MLPFLNLAVLSVIAICCSDELTGMSVPGMSVPGIVVIELVKLPLWPLVDV